jgi:hypothetical protein
MARAEQEEVSEVRMGDAEAVRQVHQPEAPDRAGAPVALLEVPRPAQARVGRRGVDRLGREGEAGDVLEEVPVLVEPRAPREGGGRLGVERGGRVAPVAPADLEAHALVEEDLALVPDLGREEAAHGEQVLDPDDRARLDQEAGGVALGRRARGRAPRRARPLRRRRGQGRAPRRER